MKTQSLAGAWEFRLVGTQEWLPASVPGGVHTDLLALGRIPDPFVGDNEKKVSWVAEADWEYKLQFVVEPNLLHQPHVWLVCDGLDTLAALRLNEIELGRTDNMFRQYRWDVKSLLKEGQNILLITFASSVKFISARNTIRELISPYHSLPGGPYIRKAPCQFGWDWGPKLPPIGIWKDIRLEGYRQARISDVHLRQEHTDGNVVIETQVITEQWEQSPISAVIHITAPDGQGFESTSPVSINQDALVRVPIPVPMRWWPNGYGDQPLYQVDVSLIDQEASSPEPIDRKTFKVGLRTIELRQKEDQWGQSFAFIVNGVQIQAKGANWIPADSFPTRINSQYLENLIRSAVAAHQNMLRVWGGGFYEDDRFYELCDRYGILVWQEFIFSCSIYPLNDAEFLENIHQEVTENIHRLRHHASLVLWCGNNEMEEGWLDWGWDSEEQQDLKSAYDQFFHQTLPAWCMAEDPDHAYWPSSPSSNTPFLDPNGQKQGDTHYWDVWHRGKPFTAYRDQFPRFMSEFGFQSLPPMETIRIYAGRADWNMTSYIMEQHQKNANGNSFIVRQMLDSFRLPKDFDSLVYISMVLQAEGIRYGVEHWRRNPDRVAGILYWQLNDCWPVASWSSLDYFGRWKALHYTARRFYAPLLLSIEDNPPKQAVYISNDLLEPWEGVVKWSLEELNGKNITTGQVPVKVLPQSATAAWTVDFSGQVTDDNVRNVVFIAECWQDDQFISRQTATFAPIKHMSLAEPSIHANLCQENGQLITELVSDTLAVLVELSLEGADVVFSDNYFNLPANRPTKISCPLPAGWTLEQAQKRLHIRSVYDTYTH